MSSIGERSMLLSCRILRKNVQSILIVRHNVGVFAPFGCEKFSKNNHLWCSKNHSNADPPCIQSKPMRECAALLHSECFFPYIQKSPSNSECRPPLHSTQTNADTPCIQTKPMQTPLALHQFYASQTIKNPYPLPHLFLAVHAYYIIFSCYY